MKNKLLLLITFGAVLQVAVVLQGYPQSSSIPEGSWRNQSFGDRTMHMLLVQKQGDTTKQFDMGFKGSIIGNSGKVLSLDGTIQTLADEAGNTTKVLKTELRDGTLVISTEDGQTYVIYDLNPNGGMIKTEPNPSAQPMTKVSQLISQLNDPDFGVRLNAAYELGESKDPSAVEPLISALKDTDMNVRQGAAGALGKIKDPSAVEPLIAALNDTDSRVRRVAAEALGDIKDPRAVEPLIAARRDPDADVQRRAAEALDEIKDAHKAVASSKAGMPAIAVSTQPTATPATSTATTKKGVQEAQQRLQALRYQPGPADGVMGARAIAALKKFQSDHHLPVTGTLDQKTLDTLKVTTPPGVEAQFPDVLQGKLSLAYLLGAGGLTHPSLWIRSEDVQYEIELTEKTSLPSDWRHKDEDGARYPVTFLGTDFHVEPETLHLEHNQDGTVTRNVDMHDLGVNHEHSLTTLVPLVGRYSVQGKITLRSHDGDAGQITAGEIKYLDTGTALAQSTTVPTPPMKETAAINLAGSWSLEMAFPEKGITSMQLDLTLQQTGATISGTATGGRPVTGTTDGSHVTLTVNYEATIASGIDIVYKGTVVDSSTMKGTVNFPQLGPGKWVAHR